jgi:hypothetical protein
MFVAYYYLPELLADYTSAHRASGVWCLVEKHAVEQCAKLRQGSDVKIISHN